MTLPSHGHAAIADLITAARAVVENSQQQVDQTHIERLQRALDRLSEPGTYATEDEVDAAYSLNESEDVDIDPTGLALISHGSNGFWVSAWFWVSRKDES